MDIYRLALRHIAGNSFRSWVVALCALLITGMVLATSLIMLGAENSLGLAISRLGADVIVVPEGAAGRVESALLMGKPAEAWMPGSVMAKVAALQGVQAVSPQLYLATLTNASCCSVSNMFLIVYDPATDFVVTPWLEEKVGDRLRLGEVIGGTNVFLPKGDSAIRLYGCPVTLRANMEPTGTGLDHSLFLTIETAREIARVSLTEAEKPLRIPEDSISAVLIKLSPDRNPHAAGLEIKNRIPGVTAIVSPDMFQSYRTQLRGLLNGVLVILFLTLAFSLLLIGLVFSMAANERRRELGVLRAIGATRGFVFQSLLFEAGLLALNGGLAGVVLTFLVVVLFHKLIIVSLGIPFLLPSSSLLVLLSAGAIGWSLASVMLAAMVPAYRISRLDPSTAMRE